MSKKLKLSQWHDGSVKPVHVGWYQVKGVFNQGLYGKGKGFSAWRKWNGYEWTWVNDNGFEYCAGFFRNDKWRGIVK